MFEYFNKRGRKKTFDLAHAIYIPRINTIGLEKTYLNSNLNFFFWSKTVLWHWF